MQTQIPQRDMNTAFCSDLFMNSCKREEKESQGCVLNGSTSLDRSTLDRIPFVFPTFDRFQCFRHWLGDILSIWYHWIDYLD